MFFQNSSFKALEAGIQYTWMQQQVHTHNISNYSTPGYKAKSIAFSETLERVRDEDGRSVRDESGRRMVRPVLGIRVTEHGDTVVRPDGNNVDMDAESLSLYKAYAHYSMLLEKAQNEFRNYNYVVNNAPR